MKYLIAVIGEEDSIAHSGDDKALLFDDLDTAIRRAKNLHGVQYDNMPAVVYGFELEDLDEDERKGNIYGVSVDDRFKAQMIYFNGTQWTRNWYAQALKAALAGDFAMCRTLVDTIVDYDPHRAEIKALLEGK